jgi:hypothetical protein
MGNTRAEITGRIDCVSGGSSQREADRPDKQTDRQRPKGTEVDRENSIALGSSDCSLQAEDAEEQNERPNDLAGEICG